MKKQKTQKGITLIALIITIVVLLILAVVTIGALDRSNIIGQAESAASSYNEKKTEEEVVLKDTEGILGNLFDSINNGNGTTPPATTEVRYYIQGTLDNPGTAVIQRVDFGNHTVVTYYFVDGEYSQQVPQPIKFSEGEKIESELKIKVQGITDPVDMKGGYKFLAEGYPEGYIKDKKLYCAGEFYICLDLVEDTNVISEIETGIANIGK